MNTKKTHNQPNKQKKKKNKEKEKRKVISIENKGFKGRQHVLQCQWNQSGLHTHAENTASNPCFVGNGRGHILKLPSEAGTWMCLFHPVTVASGKLWCMIPRENQHCIHSFIHSPCLMFHPQAMALGVGFCTSSKIRNFHFPDNTIYTFLMFLSYLFHFFFLSSFSVCSPLLFPLLSENKLSVSQLDGRL